MALTYGEPLKVSNGGRFLTITEITLDTAYPKSGYSLNAAKLGLSDELVDVCFSVGAFGESNTRQFDVGVSASLKMRLFASGKEKEYNAELAENTDVHTYTVILVAIGR